MIPRRSRNIPTVLTSSSSVQSPQYGGSTNRTVNPRRTRGRIVEPADEGEETIVQSTDRSTEDRVIVEQSTRRSNRSTRGRGGGSRLQRGRHVSNTSTELPPLTNASSDFSEYMPVQQDSTIEVECKFGLGRSTGFTTRVSTTILPVDQSVLQVDTTRDYIWNQNTSSSIRHTGTRTYTKTTRKFREYTTGNFTAKVTAATEQDVTNVSGQEVISRANLTRTKTRHSAEYRGTILSVTYVTTTITSTSSVRSGNPNTTEIEVEALPGTTMADFMTVVQEISDRLNDWYRVMQIYQSVMDPNSTRVPIYTRFLGSMPIAFRPSYSLEGYSVKYKMDGERINIVQSLGRIYFMTRGEGLIFTNISTVNTTGTVIADGEWIDAYLIEDDDSLTLLQDRHIVAFDIMYNNGTSLMNTAYNNRYSILEEWVNNTDLQNTELVLSPLMNPADVDIVEDVQSDDSVRTVWIRNDEVLYYTDGLILQSYNSIYITGTDTSQYKWKEESDITVDFRPVIADNRVDLYVVTPLGEVAATNTTVDALPPIDSSDYTQIKSGTICEFGYNRQTSRWTFYRLRTDKTQPNFITVAFDNMESAISALSTDDMLNLLKSIPQ